MALLSGVPRLKGGNLVSRMQINRNITVLGPAYSMLEVFLAGAVVALLQIVAERFSEELVDSCFLFTSFAS